MSIMNIKVEPRRFVIDIDEYTASQIALYLNKSPSLPCNSPAREFADKLISKLGYTPTEDIL